ncbi:conserved hypothetical protein [Frankia canadensis]|uniref:Uncharacterized protein n=1 Tax=Frankia canadensis TaxID=1836972 RepID=A0A2I2KP15_9ACTN|nr:hypothetical protein [Frankia canadensis]SNQ47417.1 conserved hypothetical protein [Frankia canadensis]SOU54707.1 conserved hypothetical protein [Frankia canadensis]
MDALRRGWVGLALFSAALVLMPILVFSYDKSDQSGTRMDPTVLATFPGALGSPLDPASSPSPNPGGLRFIGVKDGETISGFRLIQVEAASYTGPLEYVLNGPIQTYDMPVARPPYIFSVASGGWQTTEVPNGQYTLTAIPTEAAYNQISVTFTVSNSLGQTR